MCTTRALGPSRRCMHGNLHREPLRRTMPHPTAIREDSSTLHDGQMDPTTTCPGKQKKPPGYPMASSSCDQDKHQPNYPNRDAAQHATRHRLGSLVSGSKKVDCE